MISKSGGVLSKFHSFFAFTVLVCVSLLFAHAAEIAAQTRQTGKQDAQTQLITNYRKYADRYIRISGESWKYDQTNKIATHSFTLKNSAGVAYSDIEIQMTYLSAEGKNLQVQAVKIPGVLAAYQIKKIKDLKVRKVPAQSDQALIKVTKASIHP